MADKFWRGGAYTLRGEGDGTYDGDFDFDDSGSSYTNSNWVNSSGVGVAKPTSADTIHLSEMADRVPSSYSDSSYPHTAGKHWSICVNLYQTQSGDALAVQGFYQTKNYTGDVYGYNADTINDAGVAVDKGDGIHVGIPITGHPFSVGDYVTIAGTDYFDGQRRVEGESANEIVVKATYIAETFSSTDTVTGRTPLVIAIAIGKEMVIEGNGINYIECGAIHPYIPSLVFNSVSGYLHISSEYFGADWTDVLVLGGGTLIVARDSYVGTITVTGDSTATIIGGKDIGADSGGNAANFNVYAGTVTWDSPVGNVILGGGTFNHCPNVDIDIDVDINSFTGYNGTFNWYGKSILMDYVNYGANLTALGDGTKVFGSSSVSYNHYGGILDLSQPTGFLSIESGADINNVGGTFHPPKQQNITW
jgi:hypothetical protein